MLVDKEKNCYIQRNGKFLVYTHSCDHTATIGTVKSTLKITPRYNGVIPIKIKWTHYQNPYGILLYRQQGLPKERIQNINIIDGIHKIKGKTSVNILV